MEGKESFDAHRIADELQSDFTQAVIDAMLVADEDPTDTALYLARRAEVKAAFSK